VDLYSIATFPVNRPQVLCRYFQFSCPVPLRISPPPSEEILRPALDKKLSSDILFPLTGAAGQRSVDRRKHSRRESK
jgi:hypothetical protein